MTVLRPAVGRTARPRSSIPGGSVLRNQSGPAGAEPGFCAKGCGRRARGARIFAAVGSARRSHRSLWPARSGIRGQKDGWHTASERLRAGPARTGALVENRKRLPRAPLERGSGSRNRRVRVASMKASRDADRNHRALTFDDIAKDRHAKAVVPRGDERLPRAAGAPLEAGVGVPCGV